ncbi:LysR substrate-binding domain-containing protein [Pseudoxanthomonas putridarboris]|uniref:LysR substrate-binding domain-containing protein n=1 Tax=Pseudoxanthomonas putridarboris TaxID=752605 RepID=A0ABU9J0V6_9GAMM
MLNLNDLLMFAAAVEHGGFAAASRSLGIPKSTLSKRVAALEASLDARLIHRTSRSFTLTEVGRDFYEHARAARIEMEAAEDVVRRRVAEPSGTVRITASVPTAQSLLAELLPRIARAFPRLHIDLDVTDRFVDVVQEGYDIALRSHFAPLPDSGLVQRPLDVEHIVLLAAPGYLAEHGEPLAPAELQQHAGLLVGSHAREWTLTDADGSRVTVAPRPRMTANESVVLLGAAEAGLGIACLPEHICRDALASGRLLRVLPGWHAGRVTTTIVMPHRRGLLPGVRAVVDGLVEHAGQQRAG